MPFKYSRELKAAGPPCELCHSGELGRYWWWRNDGEICPREKMVPCHPPHEWRNTENTIPMPSPFIWWLFITCLLESWNGTYLASAVWHPCHKCLTAIEFQEREESRIWIFYRIADLDSKEDSTSWRTKKCRSGFRLEAIMRHTNQILIWYMSFDRSLDECKATLTTWHKGREILVQQWCYWVSVGLF